jgi:ribonuclease P protein subunit RPR2
MGKKQKEETPNINLNSTPNRDIIQRLNFLYQASAYLQSLESSNQKIQISDHHAGGKKKKHRRKQTAGDLARNYVQYMRIVGQKTTVKMYVNLKKTLFEFQLTGFFSKSDPVLKRSLCSSCNTTLIPGSSVSVRVKSTCFTNSI